MEGGALHNDLHLYTLFRENCEKRLSFSSCISVFAPIRMGQLRSQWMDFHQIWHLNIFQKCVEKIYVPVKSDKNSGYFT